MFQEKFILEVKEDDPSAEYIENEAELTYYLPHIYSIDELIKTVEHEWLHALFQYADEEEWTVDGDHFIMRLLGYD